MAKLIEIIKGTKFNRWTILEETETHRQPNGKLCRMVSCICDCGNKAIITWATVRLGQSKSCGCLMKELNGKRIGKNSITHGNTPKGYNEYKSLYFVWNTIKQRCYNKNSTKYHNYGAKGIKMCEEWKNNFISFRDWSINNGYYKQSEDTPYKDKLSIDRDKSDKDYTPENCRWISVSKNSSRRHINKQIKNK